MKRLSQKGVPMMETNKQELKIKEELKKEKGNAPKQRSWKKQADKQRKSN
jgi:hypothetical protein